MSGQLDHTPAEILREVLIDLGEVTAVDDQASWPCYHQQMPDSPDNCVCIYTTQGTTQGRTFDGEVQEHYGLQIKVRSSGTGGYAKLRRILNALDALIRTTVYIGNTTYFVQSFNRTTDTLPLGREKKTSDRFLYTLNGVMPIRKLDVGTGT